MDAQPYEWVKYAIIVIVFAPFLFAAIALAYDDLRQDNLEHRDELEEDAEPEQGKYDAVMTGRPTTSS